MGRWNLKQSFVEASMDNLHCINPIRHSSLPEVVVAKCRLSKRLFIFCLLWAIKSRCPWITGSHSVILCANMCVWPEQTLHNLFEWTSLNSPEQTNPLTLSPSPRFLYYVNIKLKWITAPSALCVQQQDGSWILSDSSVFLSVFFLNISDSVCTLFTTFTKGEVFFKYQDFASVCIRWPLFTQWYNLHYISVP